MNKFFVWPRMDISTAEQRFREVGLSSGPSIDLDLSKYDISSVGVRKSPKELGEFRDQLVSVAEEFGFRRRQGFQQEINLDVETSKQLDRAYTRVVGQITPMRWAEAGSREVWSWFALALLPDLTHWRWQSAVAAKKGRRAGEWYKPRWIGSDLSRHTWARYWWRSVQFEKAPELLEQLQEHDFNHLIERADTIGANPALMASFGSELLKLNEIYQGRKDVTRRDVFDDSARRMLRRMAYIEDAALNEAETQALVADFILQTRLLLDKGSIEGDSDA